MKYAMEVSQNYEQSKKTSKKEDNIKDNHYTCFDKNCKNIPIVLETHTESGKITLYCPQHKEQEIDIDDYFKILGEKEEKHIVPQQIDINNIDTNAQNLEGMYKEIEEKEGEIDDIILYDKNHIDAEESYPFNYYYKKNIINIGRYYEEENNRSHKEMKEIKEALDSEENIKKIKELEEYNIYLENYYKEKNFALKLKVKKQNMPKQLKDPGFKILSEIIFLNLIEINLSFHEIENITPIKTMLLPHLEILNMSNNEIKDIEPIAELRSKRLKEIFLHKNKIVDFEPFYSSNFPELEILRIDENDDSAYTKKNFDKVKKKYSKQIFYLKGDLEKFKRDYDIEFDVNSLKLYLGSRRKGDILVQNLFPLINYPNNIQYLYLDDNKLTDESTCLLIRMPLIELLFLDLSLNLIANIKFVKNLLKKCLKLETLYLNKNKIVDISPLSNLKLGVDNKNSDEKMAQLNVLSLKNNYLNLKDQKTHEILEQLIEKSENPDNNFDIDYEWKDINQSDNYNRNNKI